MKKLNDEELDEIKGGFGFWGVVGIISAVIFIVGVLDGITRPVKCD